MIRERLRPAVLRLMAALLLRRTTMPAQQIRRVLVIKPDHLGDVLLLTPALRVLRQQLPQAHISLLVGPWSHDVVAHNPDIDTLLTCPFPGFTRQAKGGVWEPYRVLIKTAWLLQAGRYDAALIARDDHWWGALLAALAGVPMRIGYAVPSAQPFLTHALPHQADGHVTQQGLGLVKALTGMPAPARPPLRSPSTAKDRAWAAQWFLDRGLDQHQIAALHPGTGGQGKLWIASRWAEVADALHERGMRVLLTGGPGEVALVDLIAAQVRTLPVTLVGTATVGQLAAIYAQCAVVLGVDSGPLHVATSVGTPTGVLFGPSNPQRYGPWGNPLHHHVIRSDLWCSPCNDLHVCPRGTAPSECMALISTAQVLRTVERLAGWENSSKG
jgi:heptosyltransferase-2/heptosyltransferase-3